MCMVKVAGCRINKPASVTLPGIKACQLRQKIIGRFFGGMQIYATARFSRPRAATGGEIPPTPRP